MAKGNAELLACETQGGGTVEHTVSLSFSSSLLHVNFVNNIEISSKVVVEGLLRQPLGV